MSGVFPGETPPFLKLGAERFEDLCHALTSEEPGITSVDHYGKKGQSQAGVDLIAWHEDDPTAEGLPPVTLVQCKCVENFAPANIRTASKDFLDHLDAWRAEYRVIRFVVCAADDIRNKKRIKEKANQKGAFKKHGIKYDIWAPQTLTSKLRGHPGIVGHCVDNRRAVGSATRLDSSIVLVPSSRAVRREP